MLKSPLTVLAGALAAGGIAAIIFSGTSGDRATAESIATLQAVRLEEAITLATQGDESALDTARIEVPIDAGSRTHAAASGAANQMDALRQARKYTQAVLAQSAGIASKAGFRGTDAQLAGERIRQALESGGYGLLRHGKLIADLRLMATESPEAARLLQQVASQTISGKDALEAAARAATETRRIAAAAAIQQGDMARYSRYGSAAILLALAALAILFGLRIGRVESESRPNFEHRKRREEAQKRLVSEIRQAAEGNLDIRISRESAETRDIAEPLNELLIRRQSQSEQLARLAGNLVDRLRDTGMVATGALEKLEHQEQSSNEMSGVIHQLSHIIDDIHSDAEACRHAAAYISESVGDGARSVQESVGKMEAIREHVKETSHKLKELGEHSQKIGRVVDILGQFSERIHLLAMNTSLEAARAGQQGAGFMAIARQVQDEAENSENQLSEIASLIQAIQGSTKAVSESMERTTSRAVEGAYVAEMAGANLSMISTGATNLLSMVNVISKLSGQQRETVAKMLKTADALLEQSHASATQSRDIQLRIGEAGTLSGDIQRQSGAKAK